MPPMIATLIRLYPARWRARYGDEFSAVLEERPLGPFDVADVLLGALDAHLHLRGLGAALLGAMLMTLVALIGLSAFQARHHPLLTWAAFAIPALGAVMGLFGFAAVAITDSDSAVFAGLSPWMIG